MVPHGMSLEIHREKESPGGGGGGGVMGYKTDNLLWGSMDDFWN